MVTMIGIGLGVANVAAPAVLGSAIVGSALSLSRVTLTGTSPMTFSVRWLRDNTVISGADTASYVTGSEDVGHEIHAEVTLPGGSVLASANTVTVLAAALGGDETLTLADFTRDRIVYDTGAALGSSVAMVPVSGTATRALMCRCAPFTGPRMSSGNHGPPWRRQGLAATGRA